MKAKIEVSLSKLCLFQYIVVSGSTKYFNIKAFKLDGFLRTILLLSCGIVSEYIYIVYITFRLFK